MATKVKPSRIKVTGNPQAGQVPVYVDQDNFEWKDNGEVSGPVSSTDGDIVLFDGATGKKLKDSGKKPSDYQEKLTTQTAYTAKGTSTKVPTITTNTLGQVTAITETAIAFPVTSVNGDTGAVTGLQTTSNLKTGLSDNSDTYYPSQKAVKTAVDGKQDKATSGSGAPTSTPTFIGQEYIDTTNDKMYFATGTSSSSDWTLVGSGSGMGDVTGPNSSTNGNVVLFDGTSGKLIKDSGKALPNVINNLTSLSTTDALSANQGKVLKDAIDNLSGLGKFLSLWNSSTGQPISFPLATPYTYTTGDWFMVEVVDTTDPITNYKPTGSSYTGTASTTVESGTVKQGDVYIYDGTDWLLQVNNEPQVSFSEIAGQPTDNSNLATALNSKQDTLTAGENIKISSNVISANNVFIITEDDVTVSTTDEYGVAPYNTSYYYTNIDISANAGIEWREGAIYTFVVDTEMVVASAYRNVRVKIGTGAYIPVMLTTAALGGSSYFTKTNIRQFQYTTKYEAGGALHLFTDSNTTYTAMSVSEGKTATATTVRGMRSDYLKQIIKYHSVDDTAYASSWNGVTDTAPSKNAVYDKLNTMDTTIAGKQATLVSGTNIKTINGNSILGSGNITVSSSTTVIVTLTSAGWSSNSQTVSATGVTASNNVIVSPSPDDIADYADCGVYCSAQGSGTLTFGCDTAPSNNIVVNCLVMDEGNVIVMGPQLKSYEEIVAIGNCVDIVNELNQHPLEYLNSLTTEGHIYRTYSEIMYIDLLTNTSDNDRVCLRETSSSSRTFNIWYAEGYEEWTYGSPAVIPE